MYELSDETVSCVSPKPTTFFVNEGSFKENDTPADIPDPSELDSHYALIKELVDNGLFKGESGESAYEIAVKNGYAGTEEEWLNSLKGLKGEKGDQGLKGDSYILTEADKQEISEQVNIPVKDIQVDQDSIVSQDGTASIPYASASKAGILRVPNGCGISVDEAGSASVNFPINRITSHDNSIEVTNGSGTWNIEVDKTKFVENEAFKKELLKKANSEDIPSLEGYATEEWVNNQTQPKEKWVQLVDLISTADDQLRMSGNNFPYLFFEFEAAYSNVFIDIQLPETITTTVIPYFGTNGTTASPAGQNVLGFQTQNFNTLRCTIEQLPNKYFNSHFVTQNVIFGDNENNQEHYTGNVFTSINGNKYLIRNNGIATLCFFLRNDIDIPVGTKVKIWGVIK